MILMKNDSVCGFTFTGNEEFEEHSELLVSVVHLELKLLDIFCMFKSFYTFISLFFTHLFLCILHIYSFAFCNFSSLLLREIY